MRSFIGPVLLLNLLSLRVITGLPIATDPASITNSAGGLLPELVGVLDVATKEISAVDDNKVNVNAPVNALGTQNISVTQPQPQEEQNQGDNSDGKSQVDGGSGGESEGGGSGDKSQGSGEGGGGYDNGEGGEGYYDSGEGGKGQDDNSRSASDPGVSDPDASY